MLSNFKKNLKKNPYHYADSLPEKAIEYYQYVPASSQAEAFHASKKHIKAMFGGDQSGKTGTCCYDQLSRFRSIQKELFWAAALTQEKLAAVWEWHKIIMHPSEYIVTKWRVSEEIPEIVYHRKSGSKMVYKTWASGHGSFSAEKVFDIHLDEDGQRVTSQAEKIWSDCISRVRAKKGYIELSATPVLGKNWMYRRIVEGPDDLIDYWHVSFEDNRYMDEQQKHEQRALLNIDELDRRYYGLFAILSGACFKEFNSEVSCLKYEPIIDAGWRKIRVIDFGYDHPFYCGWYALSDDGVCYQYDEYTVKGGLTFDSAKKIHDMTLKHQCEFIGSCSNPRNYRPIEASIADHDAQLRADLEHPLLGDAAIYTTPAIKEVDSGIQKVNRWLKCDNHGRSRFLISSRCPVAQQQFESYHYKEIKDGQDVKEVVVKTDDESCDTGRYAIEYWERGMPDLEIRGA